MTALASAPRVVTASVPSAPPEARAAATLPDPPARVSPAAAAVLLALYAIVGCTPMAPPWQRAGAGQATRAPGPGRRA